MEKIEGQRIAANAQQMWGGCAAHAWRVQRIRNSIAPSIEKQRQAERNKSSPTGQSERHAPLRRHYAATVAGGPRKGGGAFSQVRWGSMPST